MLRNFERQMKIINKKFCSNIYKDEVLESFRLDPLITIFQWPNLRILPLVQSEKLFFAIFSFISITERYSCRGLVIEIDEEIEIYFIITNTHKWNSHDLEEMPLERDQNLFVLSPFQLSEGSKLPNLNVI